MASQASVHLEIRVARDTSTRIGEEALVIALYCALVTGKDFDHPMTLAVNHNGGSDSTGAIVGNLLGDLFGLSGIPDHLLADLELKGVIETMGKDLYYRQQ